MFVGWRLCIVKLLVVIVILTNNNNNKIVNYTHHVIHSILLISQLLKSVVNSYKNTL